MKFIPSTAAVVAKDQQAPQSPWWDTSVTALASLQSIEIGSPSGPIGPKPEAVL